MNTKQEDLETSCFALIMTDLSKFKFNEHSKTKTKTNLKICPVKIILL